MRGDAIRDGTHWKKAAKLPVFLLANAALLVVIGSSTVRESYRGWTVDREIRALEEQATALEGKKSALVQLTNDLVSPDHVSVEARSKLDRKLPGERVIILEGVSTTGTWRNDGAASEAFQTADPKLSNPQRWWRYFFHAN